MVSKVLIIDDDPGICRTLSVLVKRRNHDVYCANTLKEGLQNAMEGWFDVVFLDVNMPDGNGLKFLPKIMKTPSNPEVIIMTGQGNPDGAELAMRNGAWDYIQKPSSVKEMTLPFVRALQYREEKKSKQHMTVLKTEGIIGSSGKLQDCLGRLAQASGSDANVLVTGETGTGKELFSRAIHKNSARSEGPYVIVDCTAIPESLVESTLFGHVKGAFTGAANAAEGLILQADGGTLMLDEVGELPLSIQKRFLRVLQEKRFRPVGGKREVKSDFRLISATNCDLDDMVQNGLFRSDLLYRLRTFSIKLPPLRTRREDIKEIAMFHMARLCEQYQAGTKGFSPDFITAVTDYSWPGNVRELVNALEQVLTISGPEPTLFPKHLPDRIRIYLARSQEFKGEHDPVDKDPKNRTAQPFPQLREFKNKALAKLEENYLTDLLSHTNGNIKQACSISGVGKSRLYELLKKYQINLSS